MGKKTEMREVSLKVIGHNMKFITSVCGVLIKIIIVQIKMIFDARDANGVISKSLLNCFRNRNLKYSHANIRLNTVENA